MRQRNKFLQVSQNILFRIHWDKNESKYFNMFNKTFYLIHLHLNNHFERNNLSYSSPSLWKTAMELFLHVIPSLFIIVNSTISKSPLAPSMPDTFDWIHEWKNILSDNFETKLNFHMVEVIRFIFYLALKALIFNCHI